MTIIEWMTILVGLFFLKEVNPILYIKKKIVISYWETKYKIIPRAPAAEEPPYHPTYHEIYKFPNRTYKNSNDMLYYERKMIAYNKKKKEWCREYMSWEFCAMKEINNSELRRRLTCRIVYNLFKVWE